jgi:hyperosmotically inducible periplasmic protein
MRSKLWKGSLTVLLAGAMALPVVAQTQASALPDQNRTAANLQRALRGGQYDQQIQQEVTSELKKHDWTKDVRATAEDGIVTLEGNVSMYSDKVRASNKVHNKNHVQGVRNLIAVSGKDVPDQQLAEKLADKLRYDRIDQGQTFNNFELAVNQGIVTIGGQARTPSDAASALAIVENTEGVKGLVDDIQVLPTSPMDDATRIRVARAVYGDPVMQKYGMDPQSPIRIVVDNGHVTLYGVVDSQMDKQIAEIRAKSVPNVFSVDDKIVVATQQSKLK